jgi:HEAT repeat protein
MESSSNDHNIEQLVKLLHSSSRETRCAAAKELAQYKTIEIANILINALAIAEDGLCVEMALGKLGEVALEPLINALTSKKNSFELGRIVNLLSSIEDTRVISLLEGLLVDADRSLREDIVYSLAHIDSAEIDPILLNLVYNDPAERVRLFALLKLGERTQRGYLFAKNPFIELLKSENVRVRQTVAAYAGNIKDVEIMRALIQALKEDSDLEVKRRAIMGLRELGIYKVSDFNMDRMLNYEAVEPLLVMLEDKQNKYIFWSIIEVLAIFKDKRVIPYIKKVLSYPDLDMLSIFSLRKASAEALAKIGGEEALEVLQWMDRNKVILDEETKRVLALKEVDAVTENARVDKIISDIILDWSKLQLKPATYNLNTRKWPKQKLE